ACLPGALGDVAASSFTILEAAERAVVLAADRLPATPLSLPGVPPLVIGAIGVAALLAIARRWRAAGLAAALAGAGLALRPTPPVGSLVVVLHSVGHGLAATVVLPDGTAVQVDAGSLDRQDAAARVLAPAFRTLGLSRLEVVSVSHADADHANAMEALLAFAPARGWIADPKGPWAPMLARSTACPRPAAMALDAGGATLRWSAPRSPPHARENDRSIVAVATFGGRTIVIPGDLEEAGARAWLDGEPRGRADVLVLPHHGLDNGQVALLADRLRPAIVLASSGGRFSTGRAEAALASRGLGLYTTHRFGSLAVVVDGDGRVTLRSVAGRRSLDED
ncbi:MAG TPA: MBL fold metallo-hydrolase, partial [Planctomycetota bacterium]|nr:MBL fold metallo-hydrolase [Planctomycetota bacterium]